MLRFANAKINLGLHITGKRDDGYHNIETIFCPVKLYDAVEIIPADTFQLHVAGSEEVPEADNICTKAYRLLAEKYHLPGCHIHLLKNIPVGAGLGGGSSDAATVLRSLDDFFRLGLSEDELRGFALQLGADCPFFLKNIPMYATGIGVDFEEIDLDLSPYYIVVVKPQVSISTAAAYQKIEPKSAPIDLRRAIRLPIQEWKYKVVNDFERGVFYDYPEIQKIKSLLYDQGAVYASLSGSGSAVYGIFEQPTELKGVPATAKIFYPVEL